MCRILLESAKRLAAAVDALSFSAPVTHVYNPLRYAWAAHRAYLERYGGGRKRVLFVGMNPGPWGMAQTGIPFGEVPAVRDWMGIQTAIGQPERPHPRRPIDGFGCARSEVSGRRLWQLFAERFGTAENFFAEHLVVNYCPLLFMGESGRNITPDKLSAAEAAPLTSACDAHLREVVKATRPDWMVAVGAYAEKRIRESFDGGVRIGRIPIGRIPHPSPASPAANRDWAGTAARALVERGVWESPG